MSTVPSVTVNDPHAAGHAEVAPEKDAADRLTHVHGAMELQATLLALLARPQS